MKNLSTRRCLSGYTLMEVLITIVVLGTLVSIVLPQYEVVVDKMKSTEGAQILNSLFGAQRRYLIDHGSYATRVNDLDISIPTPQYFSSPSVLSPNPNDPANLTVVPLAVIYTKPGSFGIDFGINIYADGHISCARCLRGFLQCIPDPGAVYCQKLGFSAS